MLTNIIMMGIVLFLVSILVLRDKKGKSAKFFDLDTSSSMRGFWCLIVILVHIPMEPVDYSNKIQDMIGSFAYIGVTFFFMTSSYGLTLGAMKKPESFTNGFWRRRLTRLLIPMFIVNVLTILSELAVNRSFDPWNFIHINGWVKDLLFFYLVVWLVHKFLPKSLSVKAKSYIVVGVVALFSLMVYLFKGLYVFGWPTELYGCIYGVLMALFKDEFERFALKSWLLKAGVFAVLSGAFGVGYLKFKGLPFVGDYVLKILLSFCILGLIFILNSKISIGNPISRFLGSVSYEVYLSHSISFILLSALPVTLSSGLFILGSLCITVILSFLINKVSGLITKKIKIFR